MDYNSFQHRADKFVLENRFTLAILFPLIGALLLISSAEGVLPSEVAFHPILVMIGVIAMRTPLLIGIFPLITQRALAMLAVLTVYTYSIEIIGIQTGIPYGSFSYEIALGPMIAGVPIILPILFIPLAVNAYLLALKLNATLIRSGYPIRNSQILTAVIVLISIDLILDPAAVALGFWAFYGGGAFYEVPLSNYTGWLLSALIAIVAIHAAFDRGQIQERLDQCKFILDDLVSFTLLWGSINMYYGNWIPVILAFVFLLMLGRYGRLDLLELNVPPAITRRSN